MSSAFDLWRNYTPILDSSAIHAAAVTPHDTNQLGYVSRALYIGTTGDVKVTMAGDNDLAGTDVTLFNVPVGILPLRVRRVFATGTTASNIVALYAFLFAVLTWGMLY